ncbi:MAG: hypothetical protein UT63_C0001G0016 [Candidatus Gottesmanbacteria bacterium GW2011_GWC2_39_8]|uniref:UDP-N-acetylglucosamine--N-acetylmuramyl-(pentapeptide) pyrophosphoryl-undecaprenol N-acetylglucosamine transferase n=1 Tax=Candidatus Gottesmanbacteria bacterium GW2011_GWC2_39_8 TaxID=1618450 RepID=A0A0G0Q246_9BACT|nr:MAG: hypothetical protein UT63_C0001G0016 [Candidatus Gottesmanbacteria bacterium GW2011_GWC2_39_8]
MTKKILITGGHFTPALSVIEQLQKYKQWKIYFVGRISALEGDKKLSVEYRKIKELNIPFFELSTGRFTRSFSLNTFISWLKIPYGLISAFFIVSKVKPDIILSFGGYIALPVALAGFLLNIPIVTHEQTTVMGLANKIIAKTAKKVLLAWTDTIGTQTFSDKIEIVGNPVRRELFEPEKSSFENSHYQKPLIYITGGSTGSHSINKLVTAILPWLLKKYTIVHQTGENSLYQDYKLSRMLKSKLKKELADRYHPYPTLSGNDVGWLLSHTDLMIGRSGANTVYELLFFGTPSLLIPLPWSGGNEQYHNAKFLEKNGNGYVLEQKNVTPEILLKEIESNIGKKRKVKYKPVTDAEKRIVNILNMVVKLKGETYQKV